jgi:hypothetical protein
MLLALFLPMNFLIRTSFVQASQGTVVEVLPSAISADVGQSFTINITILSVQNLYALDVTVTWNSSVLQLVDVDVRLAPTDTDGVLYNSSLAPVYIETNSTYPGNYEIAATSLYPAPPFNGTGNIVRITFTVTGSGYSSIDLTKSQLWDYARVRDPPISMPIEHSTVGGQFNTTIAEISNAAILVVFALVTVWALVLSEKTARKHAHPAVLDYTKQGLLAEEKALIRRCRIP